MHTYIEGADMLLHSELTQGVQLSKNSCLVFQTCVIKELVFTVDLFNELSRVASDEERDQIFQVMLRNTVILNDKDSSCDDEDTRVCNYCDNTIVCVCVCVLCIM